MTAPAQPAPAALIRVPAGTTAGAAVREAGLPGRGEPNAVVVVAEVAAQITERRGPVWAAMRTTNVRGQQ